MRIKQNLSQYKLCFVKDQTAYFANVNPCRVNGDQWGYKYNTKASPPWFSYVYSLKEIVFSLEYLGPPRDLPVDHINKYNIPWMQQLLPFDANEIYAGATIPEFKRKIIEWGGKIYKEDVVYTKL